MRLKNDTRQAVQELERQRLGLVYESAGDYRCENGCVDSVLFFAEGRILCEKCLLAHLRKTLAAALEQMRSSWDEEAEVFDLLADLLEDSSDEMLLGYAQYYYAQAT